MKSKKGFTLVEMIVVLVVFGMILAGAFTFFSYVIRSTRIISESSATQSELRNMLLMIKNEASIAEKALITDSDNALDILDILTNGANPWATGTLVFYKKTNGSRKTLSINEFNGTDISKTIYEFSFVDGFDMSFSEGDIDPVLTEEKNYLIKVLLTVTGNNDVSEIKYEDAVFLDNIRKKDSNDIGYPGSFTLEVDDLDSDGETASLILAPPKNLLPSISP
ncbi:MAG: type II secretion system GspH family protein [Clostridiales bacterium]|nr:type II secretion system GspH family protein [Clostridiales bacterium]